jgi:hypothetical protein
MGFPVKPGTGNNREFSSYNNDKTGSATKPAPQRNGLSFYNILHESDYLMASAADCAPTRQRPAAVLQQVVAIGFYYSNLHVS